MQSIYTQAPTVDDGNDQPEKWPEIEEGTVHAIESSDQTAYPPIDHGSHSANPFCRLKNRKQVAIVAGLCFIPLIGALIFTTLQSSLNHFSCSLSDGLITAFAICLSALCWCSSTVYGEIFAGLFEDNKTRECARMVVGLVWGYIYWVLFTNMLVRACEA